MSSDMPDWLAGLVSAPENEDEDQFLVAAERPQTSVRQPQVIAGQSQVLTHSQASTLENEAVMADLRSQVAGEEETAPASSTMRSRSRYVFGLLPWQIFFLSVLMFLDVAVIGMLFLVMLGRLVLPF